jgi:D-alanyl-D-alanine carboxypeptidase (penicillin-binding protein 5/6)
MTMPHDDGLDDFADLMASAPSGASHVSLSAEDAERLRRRPAAAVAG